MRGRSSEHQKRGAYSFHLPPETTWSLNISGLLVVSRVQLLHSYLSRYVGEEISCGDAEQGDGNEEADSDPCQRGGNSKDFQDRDG